MDNSTIKPYNTEAGKKKEVAQMFDHVAHSYDFLNHFFSLGIDRGWRKRVVNILQPTKPKIILDVATGTADLALALSKLSPTSIVGVDISTKMLAIGAKKISAAKLDNIIKLQEGDSEKLQFPDNNFDAVTVSFGVRNFENLRMGLSEMYRVLKPGGKVVILEFSKPTTFPIKQLFAVYFKYLLPFIGKIVSGDNRAYTYLPESVAAFPEGKQFVSILQELGYTGVSTERLTFGISTIYTASKK